MNRIGEQTVQLRVIPKRCELTARAHGTCKVSSLWVGNVNNLGVNKKRCEWKIQVGSEPQLPGVSLSCRLHFKIFTIFVLYNRF